MFALGHTRAQLTHAASPQLRKHSAKMSAVFASQQHQKGKPIPSQASIQKVLFTISILMANLDQGEGIAHNGASGSVKDES